MNKFNLKMAVGEMRLPFSEVQKMSDEDIELAYEGYLKDKITNANLLLLVLKKYHEDDYTPLSIEDFLGSKKISEQERESIMHELNIE